MLTPEAIQQAVQRIVTAAQPNRVILFGSTHGEANEDSDLDLLVIERDLPADQVANEMARLRLAVVLVGVGVDILVYSGGGVRAAKELVSDPDLLGATRGQSSL